MSSGQRQRGVFLGAGLLLLVVLLVATRLVRSCGGQPPSRSTSDSTGVPGADARWQVPRLLARNAVEDDPSGLDSDVGVVANEDPTGPSHGREVTRPGATRVDTTASDGKRANCPTGVMRSEELTAAVARARPAVVGCYRRALVPDPGLAGRIVVTFTLAERGGTGTLSEEKVSQSELRSPAFEACVLSAVSQVSFPAPLGGSGATVEVNYTFDFDPGGGLGTVDPRPPNGFGETITVE